MAETIVRTHEVTAANGYCAGHFPGHPVVPAAVQTQWALTLLSDSLGPMPTWKIQQAKYLREVTPGMTVELRLDQLKGKTRVQLVDTNGLISELFFHAHA